MTLCRIAVVCMVMAGLVWLLSSKSAGQESEIKLDKEEAKKALEYLNAARRDPPSFSKEIGADLKEVKVMPALKRNTTLAKVAEEKALDIAKRNYFAHVTPEGLGINIMIHDAGYKLPNYQIKDKKANFFESISAGTTDGKQAIQGLILDKEDTNLGHRKHLLGIGDFHRRDKDLGIAFARNPNSKYKTYLCVIIAHHPGSEK